LLVGVTYGKTLAWRLGIPLIGVHHHEGHLFAPTLEPPGVDPPFVALLVSGGHTLLLDVPAWGTYRVLGRTRDDAAGEAFDKVGTLLGLWYPAGAEIEQLAATGDPSRFRFPRPMLKELAGDGPDRYTFSFSGLKTALLRASRDSTDLAADRADLARGFQDAAVDVLAAKTAAAAEALGYPTVVLAGGVACNQALAAAVGHLLPAGTRLAVASPRLNTDNAAMIAAAGAWHLAQGSRSAWDLEAFDARELGMGNGE
jgi:N6-L-threonylcarbamoyladenine synthase